MECMKEWVVGAYKHDSCYFTEAQTCQNMECWPWKEKKKKKEKESQKRDCFLTDKKEKIWETIFLNYELWSFQVAQSWFESSFKRRICQMVSLIFFNYEYTNFSRIGVCLLIICSWHVFTNSESTKLRIFFTNFFLFSS